MNPSKVPLGADGASGISKIPGPHTQSSDDSSLPTHAQVVIIGGGVAGTSVAYHLAKGGYSDVVLVEKADLASGTTFHSAGVVGQIRETLAWTRMMPAIIKGYKGLRQETNIDPSWHEPGSLRLASSVERLEELKRQVAVARSVGLDMELITPAEAQALFPLISTKGLLAAGFLSGDGWIDPSGLTMAFAAGARNYGARIYLHTRVEAITTRNDAVTGVSTSRGTIHTDRVLNAGGMYSPEIARFAKVHLPIVAFEHQYLLTQPVAEIGVDLPVVRDPDNLIYFRSEGSALLLGGYELEPVPWGLEGIPADFSARLLPPDWPRFEQLMPGALRRLPMLEEMRVARLVNGPDAYTPDHEFILGETAVRGFFVAAGFNSQGIGPAGIVGQVMAAWIADGEPPIDVRAVDVQRFAGHDRARSRIIEQTRDKIAGRFVFQYPNESHPTGQPLRRSPAFPRMESLGAVFSEEIGWERPDWFGVNEDQRAERFRPQGLTGHHWSSAIAAESLATRHAAGLFDRTPTTKIEVSGPGALPLLQLICSNQMDRPVGSVTYSPALNRRGGVEWDLTVTRLSSKRFLVVTSPLLQVAALRSLRRRVKGYGVVCVDDRTSSYACLGLWGPKAEAILSRVADVNLSDDAFPDHTMQELTCGPVPVTAVRVGNMGERGWELYTPTEYGLTLWDRLMEAGQDLGLRPAGRRAAESLRVESGRLAVGLDLTSDVSPMAAGVDRAVRLDKEEDFLGKDALLQRAREPVRHLLRYMILRNPRAIAGNDDPIRIQGRAAGHVTSGAYGFATAKSVAFAYLPVESCQVGTVGEVWAAGSWVAFEVSPWPNYQGDRP